MIVEIQKLLDEYQSWLVDKTTLRQCGKWIEITTPYLDRHNDYLQMYVKQEKGRFLLSDDGYIIQDLIQNGCNLDSKKRKDLLKMTLNGFGIKLKNDILNTYATSNNFALKKHNFIQAMLAVNDLFYLASPVIKTLFLEDVTAWLDLHEIRYLPNVKFTGTSGYDHVFDFAIPKSPKKPERILRAINAPERDKVESLVWAWIDTKEVRSSSSLAYAVLNDTEKILSEDVTEALKNYEITPIPWSERESYQEDLAA
jgi:hypothetical protein